MTDWNITIANRALARIGGGAIGAFDEDTALAGQVRAVYDDTIEAAHTAYQWSWARRTSSLSKFAGTNESGYANAFQFPADALGQPLALFTSPRNPDWTLRDFRCEGRTIYCDETSLWGSFVFKISPDLWPPLFRMATTTWLAAALCIPVSHDKDLAQQLLAEAIGTPSEGGRGGMIGRAVGMDAATGGNRAPSAVGDALTQARFTGGPSSSNWWGD